MNTEFRVSTTLNKLEQLNNQLKNDKDLSLDDFIGIEMFATSDFRDEYTPVDAVPFAGTGMGGHHFAFLTDFGEVTDLETAPIIFVQGSSVQLVARNIKDFFRLFLNLKEWYVLENFEWYESETDFIEDYAKYEDDIRERHEELAFICDKIAEVLEITAIENVYAYIKEIREERKKKIAVDTEDHLGVLRKSDSTKHKKFEFDGEDTPELKEVQTFFNSVSMDSKLAFIRDAQQIITYYFGPELKLFLSQELHKMSLEYEANNVMLLHEWPS